MTTEEALALAVFGTSPSVNLLGRIAQSAYLVRLPVGAVAEVIVVHCSEMEAGDANAMNGVEMKMNVVSASAS